MCALVSQDKTRLTRLAQRLLYILKNIKNSQTCSQNNSNVVHNSFYLRGRTRKSECTVKCNSLCRLFDLKLHNFNPLSRKMPKSYVGAGPDGCFFPNRLTSTCPVLLSLAFTMVIYGIARAGQWGSYNILYITYFSRLFLPRGPHLTDHSHTGCRPALWFRTFCSQLIL